MTSVHEIMPGGLGRRASAGIETRSAVAFLAAPIFTRQSGNVMVAPDGRLLGMPN
ncbi:MAG TPA: hypothetical protein VFG05_04645 [Methylocella sp.]|nr:hypothetical protein [Methylocella sp.]